MAERIESVLEELLQASYLRERAKLAAAQAETEAARAELRRVRAELAEAKALLPQEGMLATLLRTFEERAAAGHARAALARE